MMASSNRFDQSNGRTFDCSDFFDYFRKKFDAAGNFITGAMKADKKKRLRLREAV
jgi:hypothetical protein